ncbi:MAG: hypothetical protein ACYC1M_00585 [Armatimonadota bacterium]
MKRQIAIFALLLLFSAAMIAEPAAWPSMKKPEDTQSAAKDKAASGGVSKKDTATTSTKPKKAKAVVKPTVDRFRRSPDAQKPDLAKTTPDLSPGVADFMQPPVWADPNYGKPVENTLPGFMQPDVFNPKPSDKQTADARHKADTLGSSMLSDMNSTSPAWMLPSKTATTAPDYTQSLAPLRKLDLGWSAPKFGDGLPGWRMNTPSLDTPYMRVQRSQNDYQQARDSLEQLYQRWAPVKK